MSTFCPDWASPGECSGLQSALSERLNPAPLSVNRLASGLIGSRRERHEYSQRSQVQILPPLPKTGPDLRKRRGQGLSDEPVSTKCPHTHGLRTAAGANRTRLSGRPGSGSARDLIRSVTNASGSNPEWPGVTTQFPIGSSPVELTHDTSDSHSAFGPTSWLRHRHRLHACATTLLPTAPSSSHR